MHVAEQGHMSATIRVDAPQAMETYARPVDVFPAGIANPAVRQHPRRVFLLNVSRNAVDIRTVGPASVKRRHLRMPAGNPLFASGRDEYDIPIRQVGGFKIAERPVGQLFQARSIDIDFNCNSAQ